jgi:hypothetical protein
VIIAFKEDKCKDKNTYKISCRNIPEMMINGSQKHIKIFSSIIPGLKQTSGTSKFNATLF